MFFRKTIRTGIGYDIHKLKKGRKFILGGVEIPFSKGELGHSDGDVLAHAIIDAILGAAGIADIGELFSPSNPIWKDANSMVLLRNAYELAVKKGWSLVNIDCVIVCEKPKILPFRELIRASLAETLKVPVSNIFLKGKTKEGLEYEGKEKTVEVFVSCLLEK